MYPGTLLWSTAVYYPTNNNEPSAIVIIYLLKTSLLHIPTYIYGGILRLTLLLELPETLA